MLAWLGVAVTRLVGKGVTQCSHLLTWQTALKINYLSSGNAFSGQSELLVVKLVNDIWAGKGCLENEIKRT